MRIVVRVVVVLSILALLSPVAEAQYFGRNKVQWEEFDFKVLQTEHFDIYYYEQEADVVHDIGRMSERWYARRSEERRVGKECRSRWWADGGRRSGGCGWRWCWE